MHSAGPSEVMVRDFHKDLEEEWRRRGKGGRSLLGGAQDALLAEWDQLLKEWSNDRMRLLDAAECIDPLNASGLPMAVKDVEHLAGEAHMAMEDAASWRSSGRSLQRHALPISSFTKVEPIDQDVSIPVSVLRDAINFHRDWMTWVGAATPSFPHIRAALEEIPESASAWYTRDVTRRDDEQEIALELEELASFLEMHSEDQSPGRIRVSHDLPRAYWIVRFDVIVLALDPDWNRYSFFFLLESWMAEKMRQFDASHATRELHAFLHALNSPAVQVRKEAFIQSPLRARLVEAEERLSAAHSYVEQRAEGAEQVRQDTLARQERAAAFQRMQRRRLDAYRECIAETLSEAVGKQVTLE